MYFFPRLRKPQMQFYRLIHQFQICFAHHPNKFRRSRFVYRANVLRLNFRGLRQRGDYCFSNNSLPFVCFDCANIRSR
jgi:hypothetical protein